MDVIKTVHNNNNNVIHFTTDLSISEFARQIERHTTREQVVINPIYGSVEVYDKGQIITTFRFRQAA